MATCGVDNSLTFASDPNNSSSISAVAGYGAIQVSWNYPTVNPHAVAHVVLRRGTSSGGIGAQHAIVKGNQYRDGMSQSQSGTTYYYWIQVVSVNGTTLATIGPASATARSLSGDTSDLLDGLIDSSSLAAALRTDIEDIPSLRSDLINETTGRLNALSDLDNIINGLGLDITQTRADVITETQTRINGLDVLASQLNQVVASNGQNLAAIVSEQTARVTATDALATDLQVVVAQVGDNLAAIAQETTARATAISAEASQRVLLGARVNVAENQIGVLDGELIALDGDLVGLDGEYRAQVVATEAAIDSVATVAANATGAVATQVDTLAALTINTFRQTTAPTVAQGRREGSLWTHPTTNITLMWRDGAWRPLESQVALDALGAVQTIQTAISNGDFAYASDVTIVEASVTTAGNRLNTLENTSVPAALAAGNQGISAANTAQGSANTAQGSANTAISAADIALADALTAQGAANTAQGAADAAQVVADNAVGDAGVAQTAADNAQSVANSAQTDANTAIANAQNAQNTANNANGNIDNYKLQVPGIATAAAKDEITAQVGYCIYDSGANAGVPTGSVNHNTKSKCESAGHEWLELRELSQAVQGVQIDDGQGGVGKIEQKMTAYRNELGVLNSQYTVKIQQHANGNYLFGGFGLSVNNQLQTIDAGFDVDTFWIGRVGDASPAGHPSSGRKPFKLVDNKVYIEAAIIEKASIGTLQVSGKAVSHIEAERFYTGNVQYYTNGSSGYNWRNGYATNENSSILTAGGSNNGFNSSDVASLTLGGLSGESYNVIVHIQMNYGIKTRSFNEGRAVAFAPRLIVKKNGSTVTANQLTKVINSAKQFYNNPQIYQYVYVYENMLDAQATYTFGMQSGNYFYIDSQWGDYIATHSDIIEYGFVQDVSYIIHFSKR